MFFQMRKVSVSAIEIAPVLVEAPSKHRMQSYVQEQVEPAAQNGFRIIAEQLVRRDNAIAPTGYTYQKEQVWVGGVDPGWVRLWFKNGVKK